MALICAVALRSQAATEPLRVCLIAGAQPAGWEADTSLAACKQSLEGKFSVTVVVVTATKSSNVMPSLSPLRSCEAALLYGGSGELGADDAAILREFLAAGKGLVVVRASMDHWAAWPEFEPEVIGASQKGRFADGYPMHVINLFPHAIFTGVLRLDTQQQMPLYSDLMADAQMIMEGTVGEATTPLAWVRRLGASRVCNIVPGDPALFRDEAYLRLLGNALLWSAHRPIPGARALVQRTYLADAYPGAFAVTLPEGPAFCLDAVRGGISQVWDGDFVDLRPRWITKHGEPARMGGEAFFRDAGRTSFWLGTGSNDLEYQFKGYNVTGDFPEFYYRVGDRNVTEQTRPLASGMGIVRRFRVGPGSTALWYKIDPQSGADIIAEGVQRDDRGLSFPSKAGGEFTIEIRRKKIIGP